jgi:peptidyl-prolyl cis-trans isomerase D
MLDVFRQKGVTSVVYGTILVATIVVFVVQFRPNSGPKAATLRRQCAATVRGNCIDPKDQRATFRLLMPRGADGESSMKQARSMGLTRLSLDALVDRELLIAEADRLGLSVSEDELNDTLISGWVHVSTPLEKPEVSIRMPPGKLYAGFRDAKTKEFDYKVFERTVRSATGRSASEFREWQKREILAAKVRDALTKNIIVGEAEAFQFYAHEQQRSRIAYVSVPQSFLRRWAAKVDEAELAAWLSKKENAEVVESTFTSRKDQITPHENHLRHILVTVSPDADAKTRGEALTRLSEAAERIRRGEAFSEVAREVSADTGSGSRGGELGDKTDNFVPPFKIAADALKAGEMTSGAIETQFGFHFIMRDDVSKTDAVLAAAKKSIARELFVNEKLRAKAGEIAAFVQSELEAGKAAADIATAVTAPYAAFTSTVPVLAVVRDLSLDKKAEGSDAAPPARLIEGAGVRAAATDNDRPSGGESASFGPGQEPFAGLTSEGTAKVSTFATSAKAGDVLKEIAALDNGFAIVKLLERKDADREAFLKDKAAFAARYETAKRLEALAIYLKRARERSSAEITIDPAYASEPSDKPGSAPADEGDGE